MGTEKEGMGKGRTCTARSATFVPASCLAYVLCEVDQERNAVCAEADRAPCEYIRRTAA
jgi:hypothetical protein